MKIFTCWNILNFVPFRWPSAGRKGRTRLLRSRFWKTTQAMPGRVRLRSPSSQDSGDLVFGLAKKLEIRRRSSVQRRNCWPKITINVGPFEPCVPFLKLFPTLLPGTLLPMIATNKCNTYGTCAIYFDCMCISCLTRPKNFPRHLRPTSIS